VTATSRIGMHRNELHEADAVRSDTRTHDTTAILGRHDDARRRVLPAARKQLVSREVFLRQCGIDERGQVIDPVG
jgi:hypothetical protein